jgi:hypothetical protein
MFFTRLPTSGTILHLAARYPTSIQPVKKPESTDQFDFFMLSVTILGRLQRKMII